MPEQQEPLDGFEATRIKITFVNMTSDSLDELPEIGDRQTFRVTTVCTARGIEVMRDGEKRRTARVEVVDLEAEGPPVKPSAAPNLFTVQDDDEGRE